MSILRILYTLLLRLLVRLFVRRTIVALPVDEQREFYPYGFTLVAIDPWKTQWTIVEGFHGARVDRKGVWYMPDQELKPSVIFTLNEARGFAADLAAVGESGTVRELPDAELSAGGELSASGSTTGGLATDGLSAGGPATGGSAVDESAAGRSTTAN